MNLLPTRLLGEAAGVVLALLLVWGLWHRIGTLEQAIGAKDQQIAQDRAAIESEQDTVQAQRSALGDWQRQAEVAIAARQAAEEQAARDRAELEKRMVLRHAEAQHDATLPDCAKVRAIDLSVCPTTAEWLRHPDRVR